ncbi:hypothetical protein CC86DRAFT_450908 [Ophiobolus disseminans]|uniref:Heterokaryon incompatibility domain-containing protein n=1 Tax=Ophiobolus disseminans TaxID=1469910 RepID=A0A6A7AK63_9PLEO|nr:hypothetical protein CC86DRAFT_450908 [Ophiobolus disseminans]
MEPKTRVTHLRSRPMPAASTSKDPFTYKYRPLIKLHRPSSLSSDESPSCQLFAVDAEKAPPFIAVSYTWGRSPSNRLIFLNGEWFWVKENLYNFLWYFRHNRVNTAHIYLWIDQICIDQSNAQECSRQVGFMSQIFKKASYVVTWLGYDIDKMAAVERFLQTRSFHQLRCLPIDQYFERLWVVQEMLLAREVQFLCRHAWIPFRDLYLCARSSEVPTAYLLWDCLSTKSRRSLSGCIDSYSSFQCQDTRDKIYGLLGLVSDHTPPVDYTKVEEEVYVDTLEALFEEISGRGSAIYQRNLLTCTRVALALANNLNFAQHKIQELPRFFSYIKTKEPYELWYIQVLKFLSYGDKKYGQKYKNEDIDEFKRLQTSEADRVLPSGELSDNRMPQKIGTKDLEDDFKSPVKVIPVKGHVKGA